MKYCSKCGKELLDEAKFCEGCGMSCGDSINPEDTPSDKSPENNTVVSDTVTQKAFVQPVSPELKNVSGEKKEFLKKKFSKKTIILLSAITVVVIAVGLIVWNAIKVNAQYKEFLENLESAYSYMSTSADIAEDYCTLESKVWRNSIYENSSSETDKYTQNEYGYFYSDFNDALRSFYKGEKLNSSSIELGASMVDVYMASLKNSPPKCQDKYKEEYSAIKEMYIAFSELTDLVIGSSSYSLDTFNAAFDAARSHYKSAASAAKVLID